MSPSRQIKTVLAVFLLGPVFVGCAGKPKSIFQAAEDGDVAQLTRAIANGADVNCTNSLGDTPLQLAASRGHKDAAVYLIAHGARAGTRDAHGSTALHAAASLGHDGVITVLLADGADPNARNDEGETPLHCAAQFFKGSVIRTLVAHGADINARDHSGATPLHAAEAVAGRDEAAEALIHCGCRTDIKDCYGYTPLHWAVRKGNTKIARLLLKKGAKADLLIAAGLDDTGLVKRLLSAGASVNRADGLRHTPLHWAAEGACLDTVGLLIAEGANVNALNGEHQNPLHMCLVGRPIYLDREDRTEQLRLKIVQALVNAGADLHARDKCLHRTPLDWARFRGYDNIAAFLIQRGAGP
jgi:ankyrin repeat protein